MNIANHIQGGGYNEARLSASNTRIELYVLFHYLCAV